MDEEKRDEEQEVKDTDADTKDVEETTETDTKKDTKKEENQTASDSAEINRKLDALIESVGLISKAIAQMSADNGSGDGFTESATQSNNAESIPDFDDMDLKI